MGGGEGFQVCMNALASCEWVDTSVIESKEALGEQGDPWTPFNHPLRIQA